MTWQPRNFAMVDVVISFHFKELIANPWKPQSRFTRRFLGRGIKNRTALTSLETTDTLHYFTLSCCLDNTEHESILCLVANFKIFLKDHPKPEIPCRCQFLGPPTRIPTWGIGWCRRTTFASPPESSSAQVKRPSHGAAPSWVKVNREKVKLVQFCAFSI